MGRTKSVERKVSGSGFIVRIMALVATVVALGAGVRHRRRSHGHEHGGNHDDNGCGCKENCCKRRANRRHGVRTNPLRILELRFACGRIDEDEFRRRRRVLQEHLA